MLSRDFSAYYIGAWRLIHDPSQVYTRAYINDGEVPISLAPGQFKYLPSFLIFIFPLLSLNYPNALMVFDLFQLSLLAPMAFLLYKLLSERGLLVTAIVSILVILLPFPVPGWSLSIAYFWQWREGQAKVLEACLLLLCFYFGKMSRTTLSGIFLGLSFFDPRFSLVAVPLFIMYNKTKIKAATISFILTLIASNFMLLYPPLGLGFIDMVLSTGWRSGFYPYALIPFLSVLLISLVNYKEMVIALNKLARTRFNLKLG
jgi:hypothetical protein